MGSSTSFQAQAAARASASPPDFGHIAASHRSATKSADARRGAAVGGELRQAVRAAASVAPDKQGVTRLQPHISRQSAQYPLRPQFRKFRCMHYLTQWAISGSRIGIDAADCQPFDNEFQGQRNRGEQFCSANDGGGFNRLLARNGRSK
jgi:hypothetical protein